MHLRKDLASIGARAPGLQWRDAASEPRDQDKQRAITFIVAGVIIGIIAVVFLVIMIRVIRVRHPEPKYIPTPFLKRLWRNWNVLGTKGRYQPQGDEDAMEAALDSTRSNMRERNPGGENRASGPPPSRSGSAAVDRNTSVRSVMTLPAYNPRASHEERVIGREGERDGIDIVVEMPTAEDEESMRDEEMEAMYQIRLARRRQLAERQERREQRRDARARGDTATLEGIRDQARSAATTNTAEIAELRAEHTRARGRRERAVSSVSYHDLGVARHDGTRIRATSTESERVGLLSDAASMAQERTERRSSGLSLQTTRSSHDETLGPEAAAAAMATTTTTTATTARSRAGSGANTPRVSTSAAPRRASLAGSSPEIIDAAEADLGGADIPPHSPPGYDEVSLDDLTPAHSRTASPYPEPPPDYPGPTEARNQRLSAHVADLVAETAPEEQQQQQQQQPEGGSHSRRASGIVPRLPSLRLNTLPQIVVEPSSAHPRD
ncbi:uncharacterized protein E0L32_011241 [Thyridium curvatum]|uniref:Uncharacterized protein n=1 Tax=Thyridium curvatum TaxID=1093900 RepID=A0A507BQI3_9PEZI|nr:uncharacterized protein E0L32_011241 [Thyridium curvatum]TPX19080.1 hypothetical protein E0L32_011241 [Thyridium curvatum]